MYYREGVCFLGCLIIRFKITDAGSSPARLRHFHERSETKCVCDSVTRAEAPKDSTASINASEVHSVWQGAQKRQVDGQLKFAWRKRDLSRFLPLPWFLADPSEITKTIVDRANSITHSIRWGNSPKLWDSVNSDRSR